MSGSDEQFVVSDGSGLLDLFPGYHPPTEQERQDAYLRGVVSLDANALLDLYRFTPKAREEFFSILEALQPRLFITYQAAHEFERNRLSVVDQRLEVGKGECAQTRKRLDAISEQIRAFSKRYQIGTGTRDELLEKVESLSGYLTNAIEKVTVYDLARDDVRKGKDSVLLRIMSLVDGRIGSEPGEDERNATSSEAERRINERIPPGYKDAKKNDPTHAMGDYALWRQLIGEARIQQRPVLLVSDEEKEDWVLKSRTGEDLGPRPELVLEMRKEATVPFLTVSVVGLLKEARDYLGITISSSTIREAESLPSGTATVFYSSRAGEQYKSLPIGERDRLNAALHLLQSRLARGDDLREWATVSVYHKDPGLYMLRWSSEGRVTFRINRDTEYVQVDDLAEGVTRTISIVVLDISIRC